MNARRRGRIASSRRFSSQSQRRIYYGTSAWPPLVLPCQSFDHRLFTYQIALLAVVRVVAMDIAAMAAPTNRRKLRSPTWRTTCWQCAHRSPDRPCGHGCQRGLRYILLIGLDHRDSGSPRHRRRRRKGRRQYRALVASLRRTDLKAYRAAHHAAGGAEFLRHAARTLGAPVFVERTQPLSGRCIFADFPGARGLRHARRLATMDRRYSSSTARVSRSARPRDRVAVPGAATWFCRTGRLLHRGPGGVRPAVHKFLNGV